MKKHVTFLTALVSFLSFAYIASAQPITLPNPLGNVTSFATLISNIAQYLFDIVATLSVIMFIWAGILFLISAGNEQRASSAKKALFYAVVGLAIALSGTGLIQLVEYIITG